jgi:hypothetical protein
MPRVHRLEHVECLGAAHLADNDAVGPHAQSVADEFSLRYLADAFDIGGARFHLHDMGLLQTQLDSVFNSNYPFVRMDVLRNRV